MNRIPTRDRTSCLISGIEANLDAGFDLHHPPVVNGDLDGPKVERLDLALHHLKPVFAARFDCGDNR